MSKQSKKEEQTETTLPVIPMENAPLMPAVSGLGLTMDDLAKDAGAGMQELSAQDLATPLLVILQSNSPQRNRADPKYIEGAVEGMAFNNVTQEILDTGNGIIIVPCYFEKVFIEWKPNRGGFVAIHPANTELKQQTKIIKDEQGKEFRRLPNGNDLVETNQHYVLVVRPDGSFEPAVIPMSSSLLRSSRIWNTLMKKVSLPAGPGRFFTPASYYMTYKLSTAVRNKDKHSWFVWDMEPNGPVPTRELYEAGKAFEKAVSSGQVRVKVDESAQAAGSETVVTEADDDGIPFN